MPQFGSALIHLLIKNMYQESISAHTIPATLSIHGIEDVLVPYPLEEAVQAAFAQQNVPHKLITLPGCGHTPLNKFADFMPAILEWLNRHM